MSDISNIAAVEHYFALVDHANDSEEKFSEFIAQAFQICNTTKCQIILGVTAKDETEQSVVANAKNNGAHIISIIGKAFKPFA